MSRPNPERGKHVGAAATGTWSPNRLTKAQIVESALEMIEAVGVEGLNMRALSAKLGVALGATYRHVGKKDDLMALVVEEIYSRVEPPPDEGDWKARTRTEIVRSFEVTTRYPGLPEYIVRHGLAAPTPSWYRIHDMLYAAGFGAPLTEQVLTILSLYTAAIVLAGPSLQVILPDWMAAATNTLDAIFDGLEVQVAETTRSGSGTGGSRDLKP